MKDPEVRSVVARVRKSAAHAVKYDHALAAMLKIKICRVKQSRRKHLMDEKNWARAWTR
jgi:hypothetical protein